jgi:hypothetical protein
MRESKWPFSFWTWLTSLNTMSSNYIHLPSKHVVSILPYGWIKFYNFLIHSLFVGHLGCFYSLNYCDQCCNKHWCASVSIVFWLTFLWVYTQKWYHWILWHCYL